MDEFDKRLYSLIDTEEKPPEKFKTIIQESLKDNNLKKNKVYYSLPKIAIATCASFLVTSGIVFAGVKISNNIWKQPEKTVGFYSEENENIVEVSNDKKDNMMSETEAREKTNALLKMFGREQESITSIELKNNPTNYNLVWQIITSNETKISFNAMGKKDISLKFNSVLSKDIDKYRTTEKKAEETARELCKKYGYDLKGYNIVKIKSNMSLEKESYIWNVYFFKEYDGLRNPYESINIGFIPEINEIYNISIKDEKYENNPIELTKEQAKQIALEAETNIKSNYKIKNTYTNLSIAKMNGNAYLRITDYEQYYKQKDINYPAKNYIEYCTDDNIRKVWAITIEYDIPDSEHYFSRQYTYFIDTTTGEIIGGEEPLGYVGLN